MKKGQRFFVIERQAGAGNEHVIAGSMEEVERIVKDTLGRPTDNRVGEINEVEVVGKYTAEVKIEPEPLYMEWKNVISDKMEGITFGIGIINFPFHSRMNAICSISHVKTRTVQ